MTEEARRNCNTCRKSFLSNCPTLKNNSEYQAIWAKTEPSGFMGINREAFEWKENFICDDYKSKYIEYPIEVSEIKVDWDSYSLYKESIGKFVRIRPCVKGYEGKTFLGLFLGELPSGPSVSYDEETKVVTIIPFTNPAIYVFDLKKIVFGMESWWGIIESEDDLKDITMDTINDQWYVKALKAMETFAG
jgi:hypothetical protein